MATIEPIEMERERFLGRESARSALLDGFSKAIALDSRSPRACFIDGPEGVGKEHLLGELVQVALDEGSTVREGGEGSRSLGGLLPFIRWALEELPHDSPLPQPQRDALDSLLRTKEDTDTGGGELEARHIAEAILAGVTGPTLFILANAHLQDPMTLKTLAELIRLLTPATTLDREIRPPCFFAVTYIDEGTPETEQLKEMAQQALGITLGGLGLDHITDYVISLLGNQPLPLERLHDLHELTDGIPGRVSDALFALQETGALVEAEGTWSLQETEGFALPASPEAVIQKRIRALQSHELEWLQTMSVESRPFAMAYALSIVEGDSKLVHAWIRRSILEQTWMETSFCVRFVGEELRLSLLASLSPDKRQEAHRRRASWIERHLPPNEAVEDLARHWASAGEPDRAISFFLASGERSQRAGDLVSTIEWYRRAMLLLQGMELEEEKKRQLEIDILLPLGNSERSNAEHTFAEERFRRLIELATRPEDEEVLGIALDRLALVFIETGRLEEAMQSARERLAVAEAASDPRGQAMALRLLGVIQREMAGPAAGIADLERALEVAGEEPEMVDVRARIAIALSFAHTEAGQPDEGLRWATWGLKLSRDAKIAELEVSFLINMSMAQFNLGRPDLTLRWATEAMDVSESKGLRRHHILALGNAGDAMRALGQFTEAEQTLRAALRETYKVGGGDLLVARMLELAHLLMDQGRGADAKSYLQEAWRLQPRLTSNRYLLALGMAECRFRLGVLIADPDGTCEMSMDDLLANVAAWAATGTDLLPEIELLVYAGLHQMKRKRKYGQAAADRAYALSSDISPSRLISKPELAAGLLALLKRAGRRKARKELAARIARAVDARAASIDDPHLREGYTALPLVQMLKG